MGDRRCSRGRARCGHGAPPPNETRWRRWLRPSCAHARTSATATDACARPPLTRGGPGRTGTFRGSSIGRCGHRWWTGSRTGDARKSTSAAPVSLRFATVQAFPARSVAVAEVVPRIVPVGALVSVAPEGVPSDLDMGAIDERPVRDVGPSALVRHLGFDPPRSRRGPRTRRFWSIRRGSERGRPIGPTSSRGHQPTFWTRWQERHWNGHGWGRRARPPRSPARSRTNPCPR
jgi:hypothetical protein